MLCWLVIRADLAENDSTVKQNDRRGNSKRGENEETEMREKEQELESKKGDMQNAHTDVQSESIV